MHLSESSDNSVSLTNSLYDELNQISQENKFSDL